MAIGKNKRLTKGKKGLKKKLIDPLTRKEWFDFKAPVPFMAKSFGKTCVTKTTGTKIAHEQIKGRVVESSLSDLKESVDQTFAWRKVKLIIDDVEGKNAVTSFYGVNITRDKLCRMVQKWHTLIEAFNDIKSNDGYILRFFTIAITRKQPKQIKKTTYAQNS